MRVTQSMISNNMMKNISGSYEQLDKYMNQVSTGKKISRPSQDPVIATKGIDYRSQSRSVKQYKRNTNEVHNWYDNSDAALDKANSAMQKIRELTVEASNDSNDKEERESIKKEVSQLKEHLENIANTKVNGKYLFNGSNTKNKPVDVENGDYPDNDNPVDIEVASGIKLQANVDSTSIFKQSLFDDISDLENALESNDAKEIESHLDQMDDHIANISDTRAELGAKMNRLDLIENRLDEQSTSVEKMLSDNEDVDYEKAITNLITQQSMHRAALSAGSKIIQPSLLDFLR